VQILPGISLFDTGFLKLHDYREEFVKDKAKAVLDYPLSGFSDLECIATLHYNQFAAQGRPEMPIAKTKKELLDAIETEYRLLKKCIEGLDAQEREQPGVCHEWSAKDVMAHLVEWKKMFLGWYEEGLRGGNPRTPAEDLKWTETPALNDRIYRKWKDVSYEAILAEFESTYAQMLELTRAIPEEKLFRKQLYPWLRVWPLARWIAAQTSSHYRWARTRIRRWANRRKLQSA
jgi:hypothetical protein